MCKPPIEQSKETKINPGKGLRTIIAYSVEQLFQSSKTQYNDIAEPLIESMLKYNNKISQKCADTLSKPIIWHLADEKAMELIQGNKERYWKLNKQKPERIEKLIDGIIKEYGETLQARLDRFKLNLDPPKN